MRLLSGDPPRGLPARVLVALVALALATAPFVFPGAKPLGRLVAVVGAKGGVGASTVAHNLAWHFAADLVMDTIIADLDLGFGTAGLDFNQDPPQGIAEAVFAPDRVDATFVDRLLSKCGDNLHLLAAPAMLDKLYDFSETAFDSLLDAMRASTPWIILDVPHGWTAWTRRTLVAADEVVVVAQPDLANLRNTKNLFDSLKKLRPNDKTPHLVLNQVGMPKRPEILPSDFCGPLEIQPTAIIPFDTVLFGGAANSGRMIAEMDAKSPVAEIMSQIAHVVTGRATIKKSKKGGLGGILAMLGKK